MIGPGSGASQTESASVTPEGTIVRGDGDKGLEPSSGLTEQASSEESGAAESVVTPDGMLSSTIVRKKDIRGFGPLGAWGRSCIDLVVFPCLLGECGGPPCGCPGGAPDPCPVHVLMLSSFDTGSGECR